MASEPLSVRAKPGVLMPRMAPHGGFTGYELVYDPKEPADHEIPGGPRYRLKDAPEEVPNNAYYRRALRRGDLLDAQEAEPDAPDAVEPPPAPTESATGESEV